MICFHRNPSDFGLGVLGLSVPPSTHRLFSSLLFGRNGSEGSPLREGDYEDTIDIGLDDEANHAIGNGLPTSSSMNGGWLETDDIEEF